MFNRCRLSGASGVCTGREELRHQQEGLVPFVSRAITIVIVPSVPFVSRVITIVIVPSVPFVSRVIIIVIIVIIVMKPSEHKLLSVKVFPSSTWLIYFLKTSL